MDCSLWIDPPFLIGLPMLFCAQKTDITYELVEDLQMKTKEFLQPNPTARAKMAAVKGIYRRGSPAEWPTHTNSMGSNEGT